VSGGNREKRGEIGHQPKGDEDRGEKEKRIEKGDGQTKANRRNRERVRQEPEWGRSPEEKTKAVLNCV
jgi:hypothetical protein